MKKYILLFVTIFLLIISLCACNAPNPASGCIRIHIRANSNSDVDQAVKLKVRDAVTAYLEDRLADCKSKSEAYSVLEKEEQTLVNIANSTLYQNDFEYKASISLSNEHFPERTYDAYTFPEGDYDALIIRLGTGEGDNWWCVAFPPLCFVPDSHGEKVVYKSWIKELLDHLFAK